MSSALITSNNPMVRQFMTALSEVYDEAGLTEQDLRLLKERGGELKAGMRDLIARLSTKAPDYSVAREILRNDFIAPEEITATRPGVVYNLNQLLGLGNTVPSREVLEWCRDNGFMVVAGPARPTSLLDIHELERHHFFIQEDSWYANKSEIFARYDRATCGWLLLRKEPVPGSTDLLWGEQVQMLSNLEEVPNVAEQVWGVTTYKAVRDVNLLSSTCVRTSSVDSHGARVTVGTNSKDGLCINTLDGQGRKYYVGVSSARR